MSENYRSWLNDVYDTNDEESDDMASDNDGSESGDDNQPDIFAVSPEVLMQQQPENAGNGPEFAFGSEATGDRMRIGQQPDQQPDRSSEVVNLLEKARENRNDPTFDMLGTLREIAKRLEEYKAGFRRLPHDPLDPQVSSTVEQRGHPFYKLWQTMSRRKYCNLLVKHLFMSEDVQISTTVARILITLHEDGMAFTFGDSPEVINRMATLALADASPQCHYCTLLYAVLYDPLGGSFLTENRCPQLVKVCIDRICEGLSQVMASPQTDDNGEESRSSKSCTNLIHFSAHYSLEPLSPLRLTLLNLRALLHMLCPADEDSPVLPSLYHNARPTTSHQHRQRDIAPAVAQEGDRLVGGIAGSVHTDPSNVSGLLRLSVASETAEEYRTKLKRILLDALQLRRHRNGELMHLACLILAALFRFLEDDFVIDLFYGDRFESGQGLGVTSAGTSSAPKSSTGGGENESGGMALLELLLAVPHDSIASGAVLRCFVHVPAMDKLASSVSNQRTLFAILDYAVVIMDTGGPFCRTEALKVVQKLIAYGPALRYFDRKDPIRRLFNVMSSLEWYSSSKTSIQTYCSVLVPQLVTTMHAYTAFRAVLWLHWHLPKSVRIFSRSPTIVYKTGNLATAYSNAELQRAVVHCLPFLSEEMVFPVGQAIHEHSIPGNATGFILLLRLIRRLSRMSSEELDLYPNRTTDKVLAELLDILAYSCLTVRHVREILYVGIQWDRITGAETVDTSGVIHLSTVNSTHKTFFLLRHLRDVLAMMGEDKNHMLKLGAVFFLSVCACRFKVSELPSRIATASSTTDPTMTARKRKRIVLTTGSSGNKNSTTHGMEDSVDSSRFLVPCQPCTPYTPYRNVATSSSSSYLSMFDAVVHFIRVGGLLMDLSMLFTLDRPAHVLDNLRFTTARLLYALTKDEWVRLMLAHMPTLQRDYLSNMFAHPAYPEHVELHQDLQHYLRLLLRVFERECVVTIHGVVKSGSAGNVGPGQSLVSATVTSGGMGSGGVRMRKSSGAPPVTMELSLPMIQWNNNDLNEIIYRHLLEKGYSHTAEVFKREAHLTLTPHAPAELTCVDLSNTATASPAPPASATRRGGVSASTSSSSRVIPLPSLWLETNNNSDMGPTTDPVTPAALLLNSTPEKVHHNSEVKRHFSIGTEDSPQLTQDSDALIGQPPPAKMPRIMELQRQLSLDAARRWKTLTPMTPTSGSNDSATAVAHGPLVSRVLEPTLGPSSSSGPGHQHQGQENAGGDMSLTELVGRYLCYQHQNCTHSQALQTGPVSFSLKAAGNACPAITSPNYQRFDAYPNLLAPDCVRGLRTYGYPRSRGAATGLRHYMYSNFSRVMEARPEESGVRVLVFTPEDSYKFYCLSNDNECYFYSGEEYTYLPDIGEPCHLLNLSRDGRIVGIGGASTISLMNVEDPAMGICKTWKTLATPCDEFVFNNHGPVKSILNDYYHNCDLWDVETCTRLLTLRPHVPELYFDEGSGQFSMCDRLALFSGTLFDLRAPDRHHTATATASSRSGSDGLFPSSSATPALVVHKMDRLQLSSGGVFHPNEREIVCADYIFDLRNPNRLLRRVPDLENATVLFTNDGGTLLTIPRRAPSQEEDFTPQQCVLKTFDASTYEHVGSLQMRHSVGGASVDYNGLTLSVTVNSQASYWSTFVYELGVAKPDDADVYEEEVAEEDEFFAHGSGSDDYSDALDITVSSSSSSSWTSTSNSDDDEDEDVSVTETETDTETESEDAADDEEDDDEDDEDST